MIMVPRKSARKAPRKPKPKQELYVHKEEKSVWTLVKRSRTDVVLKATFTGESRRPKLVTFGRDYSPMEAKAGGAR